MLPDTTASYSFPPGPVKAPEPRDSSVVPSTTSLKDRTVKTPEPAGIVAPVNEKPITVSDPVETVNPASSAAPPKAPVSAKPETLNWKPATELPKSYKISKLPEESNAPNETLETKQALSPSQTPQSSTTASPKHTPAQS